VSDYFIIGSSSDGSGKAAGWEIVAISLMCQSRFNTPDTVAGIGLPVQGICAAAQLAPTAT
jgi:hypothetical protein